MVSAMTLVSGSRYESQTGKRRSSSPAPDTKAKTDGQNPFEDLAAQVRVLGEERVDSLANILPYVRISSQKQDAHMARGAVLYMLRQKRSPAKSQRRAFERIRCFIERVFSRGLCVSRFPAEKIYS